MSRETREVMGHLFEVDSEHRLCDLSVIVFGARNATQSESKLVAFVRESHNEISIYSERGEMTQRLGTSSRSLQFLFVGSDEEASDFLRHMIE